MVRTPLSDDVVKAGLIKRGRFPGWAVGGNGGSAKIWGQWWQGKEVGGDVGLVKVLVCETCCGYVWLKKECVTDGGREMVHVFGRKCHEVWSQE
jgi:hypothetical protein